MPSGRTAALIKAGLAAAATAKLVSNARENAKANPTLCKTIAAPLDQLAASLNGVVDGLKSGSLDAGAIGGLSGLLGSLKQKAAEAGVPVHRAAGAAGVAPAGVARPHPGRPPPGRTAGGTMGPMCHVPGDERETGR